jgi:chromosomal replication initiation ATPase DnaA
MMELAAFYDAHVAFKLDGYFATAALRRQHELRKERARILSMAMQIIDADAPQVLTVKAIVRAVQDYYGFSTLEMQSGRKRQKLCEARQVCMYLAREHTGATNREIGLPLGGRDPSTAFWGQRSIRLRLASGDEDLAADVAAIRSALKIKDQRFCQSPTDPNQA